MCSGLRGGGGFLYLVMGLRAAEPFLRGVVHHSPSIHSQLSSYPSVCLSVCLSVYYLSSTYLPSIFYQSIIYYHLLSLYVSVFLFVSMSLSLSLCLFVSLTLLCPAEVFVSHSATPRTACLQLTWSTASSLGATVKQDQRRKKNQEGGGKPLLS